MRANLQVQADRVVGISERCSSDRCADVAVSTRPARRAPLAARMSLRLRASSRDLTASFTDTSLTDSIGMNDEGRNNANAPRLCGSVAGHMSTAQVARLVAIDFFEETPGQGLECSATPGRDSGNTEDPDSTILIRSDFSGFVEDAIASDGVATARRPPQRARLAASMPLSLRTSSRDLTSSFTNISLTKGGNWDEGGRLFGQTAN